MLRRDLLFARAPPFLPPESMPTHPITTTFSDVVVQIVDARHPLLFRCPDLEEYVKEVSPEKRNLLLINKADLLTVAQRDQWVRHRAPSGVTPASSPCSVAPWHACSQAASRQNVDRVL